MPTKRAMLRYNPIDPDWAWQPYTPSADRPWNRRLAAHLFRRAGFAATPLELDRAVEQGFDATLDQLFDIERADELNAELDQAAEYIVRSGNVRQLASAWLLRMLQTPSPLLEKMTLFWHGHFATSAAKVTNAAAMHRQNQLLRKHALGRFEPMVRGISADVAMLVYLDSTDNRKTRPNENYARELLELFCLGLDNYTERDVVELARCFTGWEVRSVSGASSFQFNAHQHDTGEKTLFGQRGAFTGEQAISMVLNQPAAARFLGRKLIRFFIFDERPIDDELVEPLAEHLRANEFDIAAAVRQILTSNLFYSELAVGQKIRGPVELLVGLLRQFEARSATPRLVNELEQLGQLPLFPPNVKGWDGGRKWLNASTLLGRANFVHRLARLDQIHLQAGSFAGWAEAAGAAQGADLADWLCQRFLATDPPAPTLSALREIAEQNRSFDVALPNLFSSLAVLPELQLN